MPEFRFEPIRPRSRKWPLDVGKLVNGLVRAMSDSVKSGQAKMQTYPPQLPTLYPYRRTGTLRRSWSSDVTSGSNRIVGVVGSNSAIAPYNRQVQGTDQVPYFDSAGWPSVADLKGQLEKDLPPRLRSAVKSATV